MRLKMIGFAGTSLLLLAGCDGKSPQPQADNSCVQKPVCAAPAQPAPPPAATTPPPSYGEVPRPRRAARYRYSRRASYSGGSYRYEGETKDYGQVYSTGDTRYGTRVQVQTTDSYTASGQTSTSYSSYGSGGSVYVAGGGGYSSGGGVIVVDGSPAGCPGACGPSRPRVAGRDRYGYLTWPSK